MIDLPEGWLTQDEAAELRRLAVAKTVLELGSWKGRSTVAMAETAECVWAVDTFNGDDGTGKGDTWKAFTRNVMQYILQGKIVPSIGRFEDVLPTLSLARFGLAFVDGDHSYDQTRWLLETLTKGMQQGATIAVHDWSMQYPDVLRATQDAPLRLVRVVETLAVFEVA